MQCASRLNHRRWVTCITSGGHTDAHMHIHTHCVDWLVSAQQHVQLPCLPAWLEIHVVQDEITLWPLIAMPTACTAPIIMAHEMD